MLERPGRDAAGARDRANRLAMSGAALLATLGGIGRARAASVEVDATTTAQGYQVAGPWGDTMLDRRRLMQTLSLSAYDLQGSQRVGGPSYSAVLMLRLDADFGIGDRVVGAEAGGETSYGASPNAGARYVPGLRAAPLDLVYGYVEGRGLARGWVGFRLGRQYITDMLGWWSFDGALLRITTPLFLRAEAYGGFEQRGGLPLSTSRYEAQGVWRGSHADFGANGDSPRLTDYPSYQYAEPAPAFGAALETVGLKVVHGRLDYRHVYNTGTSITQQFPDAAGGYRAVDGVRTSTEKVGVAADASVGDYANVKSGLAWDLYAGQLASCFGSVEGHVARRATLGADVDYFVPTFDADSIWNWFARGGVLTATGRAAMRITTNLEIAGSAGARQWQTEGDPSTFAGAECDAASREGRSGNAGCSGSTTFDPSTGAVATATRDRTNRSTSTTTDTLANLSARYSWPSGLVSARGMVEAGERGRRVGGDLAGEKRLSGGRYSLGTRTSLYDWNDPLRPERGASSFGYVLGFGFRPASSADVRLEWEHDMNRLVGQRFRVVALLNVWVGR